MKSRMYMLNHQRQLIDVYGSKMNESTRAYNDMKLRLLEAEAFEELKRDLIQSAEDEMAKANSENARHFVDEVNKAFHSLRLT